MPKSRQRKKTRRPRNPTWLEGSAPKEPPNFARLLRPESNSRVEYVIVPIAAEGTPKALIERTPVGSRGKYRVSFVLTVPGKEVFRDTLNLPELMVSGDSLLWLGKGRHLAIENSDQPGKTSIAFSVNQHGRLSTVHIGVVAEDFDDAQRIAYANVMSVLSELSFQYDVALDVAGYEAIEELTEVKHYSFALAGRIKPFNRELHVVSNLETRRLMAAYREGLNATNVFYQALSFYKVAEGVAALRKRQLRKDKASFAASNTNEIREEFPTDINDLPIGDEFERSFFEPYLGKGYSDALVELKEQIRNAIAHLGNIDDVIDVDRYGDVQLCVKAIPVLKYIAHSMLNHDLQSSQVAGQQRLATRA